MTDQHSETLFDMAVGHYNAAMTIHKISSKDKIYLNFVAYHLQQVVELSIKHVLELEGIEYPNMHDIDQLILYGKEQGVGLFVDGYIDEHAEMFTQWESKTRYVKGYRIEARKIGTAIEEIKKYLEKIKEYNHELGLPSRSEHAKGHDGQVRANDQFDHDDFGER